MSSDASEWPDATTRIVSAKLAGRRVRCDAAKVNVFKQPLLRDNPATLDSEVTKSIVYLIGVAVASVALVAWYLVTPQTTQVTTLKPSYDQYQSISQFTPTCPCSTESVPLSSSVLFNVSASAIFSLNECSALNRTLQEASAALQDPLAPIPDRNAAAMALIHLTAMVFICGNLDAAQQSAFVNVLSTQMGPTLLSSQQLDVAVTRSVLQELQKLMLTLISQVSALRLSALMYAVPSVRLSENATAGTPPGCTCTYTSPVSALDAITTGVCLFHIVFDWRNGTSASDPLNPDTWWTCSVSANVQRFPTAVLADPFYRMLGLRPPYDRFAFAATPGAITFSDVVGNVQSAIFMPLAGGGFNYSAVRPGLFAPVHTAHFASCQPASCTYTITSIPSAAAALTTALGTISGVRGMLFMAVPVLVDLLLRCRRKKSPASVPSQIPAVLAAMPAPPPAAPAAAVAVQTHAHTHTHAVGQGKALGVPGNPSRPLPAAPPPMPAPVTLQAHVIANPLGQATPR